MITRLRTLTRDALILVLLAVLAAGIGQWLAGVWKEWQQPPQTERFDSQILSAEGMVSPVMIASSTCPACASARTWMAERGIVYQELTVDRSEQARKIADRLNVKIVPTFLIGDVRVNGFIQSELQQRLPRDANAGKL